MEAKSKPTKKDIDTFFGKMKSFKEKQDKQKQHGLNDYNMVNVVRKATHEVGMHSNVIYSLIDPNGVHYQGDLFLNLFVKEVLKIDDIGTIYDVQAEESTTKGKRIDFTIKSDKYLIGIEMKVNHHDSNNQIKDYSDYLCEQATNDEEVKIYYLTKFGSEAHERSHRGKDYTRISFSEDILKWIDLCQQEVRNITNLNEAFENYKNIVKKITNKYKGNVVTLIDYIRNEIKDDSDKAECIKLLDSIGKEYKRDTDKLKKDFFTTYLPVFLQENLAEDGWKVKFEGKARDFFKGLKTNIKIYKKEDWKICYMLKFCKKDLKMYSQVAKVASDFDLELLRNEFIKLKEISEDKKTSWSLYWKYSDNDLTTKLRLLINGKEEELAQNILDEFKNVCKMLENEYGCSLDSLNDFISKGN